MVNIYEPSVSEDANDILRDVFSKQWLGRGVRVQAFEQALSAFLGVNAEEIFTVASCTDAIFGAPTIFDIPRGAEIIMPTISFVAVGSAVVEAGLKPIFVDIDPFSGNVCFNSIRSALTPNTRAIFVTDYGGIPVDVAAIRELVGPHIRIFHDCAASLGTFVNGQASGIVADYACWSFDPAKLITCGEGGAIFVKDPKYRRIAREYFYHGLSLDEHTEEARAGKRQEWWKIELERHGRRSMFTNVNAAIGLPQIRDIDKSLARKAAIRCAYIEGLRQLTSVAVIPQFDEGNIKYSNYFFTITTKRRNELALFLKKNGVRSTFKYTPLHRIELFKAFARACPQAEEFSDSALNIPIHQHLSNADVKIVIDLVSAFHVAGF